MHAFVSRIWFCLLLSLRAASEENWVIQLSVHQLTYGVSFLASISQVTISTQAFVIIKNSFCLLRLTRVRESQLEVKKTKSQTRTFLHAQMKNKIIKEMFLSFLDFCFQPHNLTVNVAAGDSFKSSWTFTFTSSALSLSLFTSFFKIIFNISKVLVFQFHRQADNSILVSKLLGFSK